MLENNSVVNVTEKNLFKDAFQSEFNDQRRINQYLTTYVNECALSWKINHLYSPIAIVAQSSGYGKTRSLFENAKKHVTVYICCRSAKENASQSYPNRSNLAYYFERSFLEADPNKGELFLAALVQSTLDELKTIVDTKLNDKILEGSTIAKELRREAPSNDKNTQSVKQRADLEEAIAIEFMKSQPWLDYPTGKEHRVSEFSILMDHFYSMKI